MAPTTTAKKKAANKTKTKQAETQLQFHENDPLWYKDAIIYELHIKAFNDSNKDGIGDFKGLIEKLDYLEDLGVTAIWVLPFYPSPLRDDGYDIADYFTINPSYGDVDDFKDFMKEAKKRGLKVITELVINHTSDQHPWFQKARKAPKGSPERDFYVWSDDPNKYNEVRIIFNDYEASNWTWDPVANQYYWHRFFHHQPDLNFDNPKVQDEIFRVLDYWFDLGVDGFRLDAVPYLFEREGTNCENLPETHTFLKKLRKHVDKKYKSKLLLAEANMWPEDSASYFGNGDECHMNYHFPIMPRLFMSVKMEDRYPIIDIFDQTPEIPENCQWAMFLRNHDELTLEMVTDEERDYMYRVYTKDPLAKINMGIRHRLAPLLDNNRKKIELMNVLLFSLPGTPVLYYGDEIGMGDNFYLGDRDGVRTPMQWSADKNAGFSGANPQQLYLPVIIDPEYRYEAINVEMQQQNTSSLLWWMKRVINMRKRFKAFSRGEMRFLHPDNSKCLSFLRVHDDEIMLVVANLSRFSQPVQLNLKEFSGYVPVEVFSQNKFPQIQEDPYLITVGPHGYYWFLLKKDDHDEGYDPSEIPTYDLSSTEEVFEGKNLKKLEEQILPSYLKKCRWFGGKARKIQQLKVIEKMPFEKQSATFLLFEVTYQEGLPEIYQLIVATCNDDTAEQFIHNTPQGVICHFKSGKEKGILYDALFSEHFRKHIFELMLKKKSLKAQTGEFNFHLTNGNGKKKISSRILGVEQSNTSIIYNDKYFMKLYRKLDRNINPDVEITRFLSETAGYTSVPPFKGAIEHVAKGKSTMTIAMVQEMVQNQGDAWEYFNDTIKRYYERVLELGIENNFDISENLTTPLTFEELPDALKQLLGGPYIERIRMLGKRTAEMHLALNSSHDHKDFAPEGFSLHYQRSVFSSFQTLVRSSWQTLDKTIDKLPENVFDEARDLLSRKSEVLEFLKKVFDHKIDTSKIRIHGDFHLGQVLYTGKDFIIIDFEGEPARSYSDRRLKRSPLRDVAGMLRSFHYAAYNQLLQNDMMRPEDVINLEQWAEVWYHFMGRFYLQAYMETAGNAGFIPSNSDDMQLLIEVFIMEKAVYEISYELNNRPGWVIIPIRGIKTILGEKGEG